MLQCKLRVQLQFNNRCTSLLPYFLHSSQLKKFLGRKMESAVNKARSLALEVSQHRHREERDIFEDDAPTHDTMHFVKVMIRLHKKFYVQLYF